MQGFGQQGMMNPMGQGLQGILQKFNQGGQNQIMPYNGGDNLKGPQQSTMTGVQGSSPMPGINSAYMGGNQAQPVNSMQSLLPKNPQAGTPMGRSSFLGSGGLGQGMINMSDATKGMMKKPMNNINNRGGN